MITNHHKYRYFLLWALLLGPFTTHAETDCTAVTEISQVECESLLQLYHSTDGPNWTNNNGWNVTNMPCSWRGITCENNGVVEINLNGFNNNLVGSIPNFNDLPNLRVLDISFTQLTGAIPDFSGLPNLQSLELSINQLTGPIPNFSNLPNLQNIYFGENRLTGHIPNFNHLPNLQSLDLNGNQLSGAIPNFNALPNLSILSLGGNQLTGSIPDFSNLSNLQVLSLASNRLTGPIPDFSSLPHLQTLNIWNNQLTGTIPDFSALPHLQTLELSSNQLTGTIPDFSSMPNLKSFSLEGNQLTTIQIILEKENYRIGEDFKAELRETFSEGYDLYVAVLLPNGMDFIALENTNQFALLNQPQKWLASRVQNEGPITLLDLTLPADLVTGQYCLYGILSPENQSVLDVADEWVMDSQCVEINSTN
jgi:Leucine-rich repeat (LRR) protein